MGRKFVIKIYALKNFKINIHQNVSRAFNILHYSKFMLQENIIDKKKKKKKFLSYTTKRKLSIPSINSSIFSNKFIIEYIASYMVVISII